MTAPLPPNADELVSAYLDGQAAPDEIAFVEANPELMARVEAMRSVSAALAAPAEAQAEVKQAHLAAALGEFDQLFAAGEFGGGPQLTVVPTGDTTDTADSTEVAPADTNPVVTSIAAARERKRPRRFNLVAAAAAVVALLFAGIVAVGLNAGTSNDLVDSSTAAVADDRDESASSDDTAELEASESFVFPADDDAAADATDAGDAEAPFAAEAEAMDDEEAMLDEDAADESRVVPLPTLPPPVAAEADGAAGSGPVDDAEEDFAADDSGGDPADLYDLGDFASIDELQAEITALLDGAPILGFVRTRTIEAIEPPETSCAALIDELIGTDAPTLLALATLGEIPVEVHGADDILVLVIDRDTCTLIDETAIGNGDG